MVTAVGDVDPSQITVTISMNGQPLAVHDGNIMSLGQGWFLVDIPVPPDVDPLAPVIMTARLEGSPEWRDIHEFMNITDTPDIDLINQKIDDLAASVNELAAAVAAARFPTLADIASMLSGLKFITVPSPPGEPDAGGGGVVTPVRLSGVDVVTRPPSLSRGVMKASDWLNLLGPGEVMGPELIPVDWGRYDSANQSTVIDQGPDFITIRYDVDGKNQQVWKVITGLAGGDYVMGFRVESLTGGGSEVYVRLHKDPYTPIGYVDTVEAGTTIRKRITLTPDPDGLNPTRLQFAFGGLHLEPETYTIKDVTLRRIE